MGDRARDMQYFFLSSHLEYGVSKTTALCLFLNKILLVTLLRNNHICSWYMSIAAFALPHQG